MLAYINITENRCEIVKCDGKISDFEDTDDIRKTIKGNIQNIISDTDLEKMTVYFDLDTLSERLKGKEYIFSDFSNRNGQKFRHSFIPLSWDEDGNLLEVLSGIHSIKNK